MYIRGKRGKIGKGYSLKDTNKSGTYYVYVWNKDTYTREERGETKNSKVGGWRSLGNFDKEETYELLDEHLKNVYGAFVDVESVIEDLQKQKDEMEAKRKEVIEVLEFELKALMQQVGIEHGHMPKSVAGLQNKIKKVRAKLQ